MKPWAVFLVALVACVGPDYQRPKIALPAAYSQAGARGRLDKRWWRVFGDDALAQLERRALRHNPDVRAALARVAQARAVTTQANADYYPTVTFNPSVARSRSPLNGGDAQTTSQATFDLTYELDVWGRVGRSVEAAEAQARATAADYAVVRLSITTNVAVDYFTIRSLSAQAEVLDRALDSSRRQVELIQIKLDAGLVGPPDLLQAQAQRDATLAQRAEVLRQRTNTEHALAILTGAPPFSLLLPPSELDDAPPRIPAGLPSALLRRRPDVSSAEERLIAATAAIGVAEAELYPHFNLTGSAGLASSSLADALSWGNRLWSIGAGLVAPVIEGGRLRAEVERTNAVYDEALAAYRGAVLQALADVEVSLNDLGRQAESDAALARATAHARENLRLMQIQYDQGLVDYLQVLDAQRTLLDDELRAVQARAQRYVSTVLLIKALGGGWSPKETERLIERAPAEGPRDNQD
jgi:outer membrane protein, multidrug efflux system